MNASTSQTVVLFSVDGMRPDGILQANTPVMRRMMQEGAYTLEAQTVMPSVTLPCHTSMLRGVDVTRHGITTNTFQPLARPVPSLMDVASLAGRRVGFFYNWGELRDLAAPGSTALSYYVNDSHRPEGDWRVTNSVIQHLQEHDFDFLFVYLGYTDECGHKEGWISPPYLDAISNADNCIGAILSALQERGRETVSLVQSDHGGHGRSHGTDCAKDMTIPWILCGKGVRSGIILQEPVRIYDTCCTLASLLDLPAAREWEGRIIREALF